MIHSTGFAFYAFYASGELQDWAEPKGWQVGNGAPPTDYGTGADKKRTPSITTNQLSIHQNPQPTQEKNDAYPQPYQASTTNNPFTAVWNENYQ